MAADTHQTRTCRSWKAKCLGSAGASARRKSFTGRTLKNSEILSDTLMLEVNFTFPSREIGRVCVLEHFFTRACHSFADFIKARRDKSRKNTHPLRCPLFLFAAS